MNSLISTNQLVYKKLKENILLIHFTLIRQSIILLDFHIFFYCCSPMHLFSRQKNTTKFSLERDYGYSYECYTHSPYMRFGFPFFRVILHNQISSWLIQNSIGYQRIVPNLWDKLLWYLPFSLQSPSSLHSSSP